MVTFYRTTRHGSSFLAAMETRLNYPRIQPRLSIAKGRLTSCALSEWRKASQTYGASI